MASTIFRPLPSSSRMSSTAKAGRPARRASCASAMELAVVTSKPRDSSARPRRVLSAWSSSSSNRDLSSRAAMRSSRLAMILSTPCSSSRMRHAQGSRRRSASSAARGQRTVTRAPPVSPRSGRHPRAGALQQGPGDEEAQPHAAAHARRRRLLALARSSMGPAGDIGLAQTGQDFRREAGTVVGDDHLHVARINAGDDSTRSAAKSAAFSTMADRPWTISGRRRTWGARSRPTPFDCDSPCPDRSPGAAEPPPPEGP